MSPPLDADDGRNLVLILNLNEADYCSRTLLSRLRFKIFIVILFFLEAPPKCLRDSTCYLRLIFKDENECGDAPPVVLRLHALPAQWSEVTQPK